MRVNYQHLAISLNVIHIISSNLKMHFKMWFIGRALSLHANKNLHWWADGMSFLCKGLPVAKSTYSKHLTRDPMDAAFVEGGGKGCSLSFQS